MTNYVIFILFCLVTSWYCIGLFAVSEEGYLLHFLKRPYNKAYDALEVLKTRKTAGFDYDNINYRLNTALVYLMKPLIGCPTCMASVWTFILYLHWFKCVNFDTVIAAVVVAFLNDIHYSLYRRL